MKKIVYRISFNRKKATRFPNGTLRNVSVKTQ